MTERVHISRLSTALYDPQTLRQGKVDRMVAEGIDPARLGTFTARKEGGIYLLRDGLHRLTAIRQLGLNMSVNVEVDP